MIDSHAHLFYSKEDEDRLIENAKDAGLTGIVNVAVSKSTAMFTLPL